MGEKIPYCFPLIRRACRETWRLVFAAPPITIGIAVVIYLLSFWLHEHKWSLVVNAIASAGWTLLATVIVFGAAFLVYFFYVSPKGMYLEARTELKRKTELLDHRQQRNAVADRLSRELKAIEKFVKVLHDPNQAIPIDTIDEWERRTCIYLRENLSEAHENLFMSEAGAPRPPIYGLIEERAEPLQRLHYRYYQLGRILDRLVSD